MPVGSTTTEISATLVRRLVAAQFPRWSSLPVRPVPIDGWDNCTFRLGGDLLARLPSAAGYADQVAKEQQWLPPLAPLLPLPIPAPVAVGGPGEGYPWSWSVYRWLPGETADVAVIGDPPAFGRALARFLNVLHGVALGGPQPGAHNFHRGGLVSTYDGETRAAASTLAAEIDTGAVMDVWEAALASRWQGPDGWVHGDVAPGNLLLVDGALSAVIDFGSSAVGDPACDLTVAWTLLEGAGREAFRSTVDADDGTWARARGWALWKSLITIAGEGPHVAGARRTLECVLAEHAGLEGRR